MNKQIKEGYSRYFIAIIPSGTVLDDTMKMKEDACQLFLSCASLNSPPHITLHMPFIWKDKRRLDLESFLKLLLTDFPVFEVNLVGAGAFGKRNIHLKIEENNALIDLQKQIATGMKKHLNVFNANYKDFPFQPHLTIAFRDLKKYQFEAAFEYFKHINYNGKFKVSHIALLKFCDGKWEKDTNYALLS